MNPPALIGLRTYWQMSVDNIHRLFRKSTIGPGAAWHKIDCHVHCPSSIDYEYSGADADELLGRALTDQGYSLAVILKHQEFPTRDELARLQKHCPRTTLIPGAEINVIVEALFKKIGKDYFFHCIVAVDPHDGDFSYLLRMAQGEFTYRSGDYPAGFRSSILDVARFFREKGALFIPAHLHQARTPANSRSVDDLYDDDAFLGFVQDRAFDALEVRQRSTAHFFMGGKITPDGRPIPQSVCVASSDAHHHDHIASRARATWILAEKADFNELKAALSFPHRVLLDEPITTHARILGVHIVGAFIPETWLSLNAGLNALIGAKGSGKTAILECLRFVLNTPVPNERIENVKRHVTHVLGSAGYVECLVELDSGDRMSITRRADSPDRIVVTASDGSTSIVPPNEGAVFPISILGWHEIEAVADRPAARIALLDRVSDERIPQGQYEEIKQFVEQARDLLPSLQRQIKRLDSSLKELWDLQNKRRALGRLEEGALLDLQRQYEWFLEAEQRLEALRADVVERTADIEPSVRSAITLGLQPPPNTNALGEAEQSLISLSTSLKNNLAAEEKATEELREALTQVHRAHEPAASALARSFATFREEVYTPKVNDLPPEDREILTRQIQVLEETKRLGLVEKRCADLVAEVGSIALQLKQLCQEICRRRDAIASHREALTESLNNQLSTVRLQFRRSANHEARGHFQSRYPGEGSEFIGLLQGYGKTESYQNLVALFESLTVMSVTQEQWSVNKLLWDVRLLDLLDVIDDDDVEISLLVGKAGFVPLQNLSAGQRSVAVFPLLLRNARGPLVIDQPEDNLDNRYIADSIAPDLLARKRSQQFVVTSHNANLVVLTDADLIIHVDSDGATSSCPESGFLACATSRVKHSVLDVLDGGEPALRARQHKYGVT